MNLILHFAPSIPSDFKLRNVGLGPEEQQAQAQQELKQVVEAVLQQVHQDMQGALEPILEENKKQSLTRDACAATQ